SFPTRRSYDLVLGVGDVRFAHVVPVTVVVQFLGLLTVSGATLVGDVGGVLGRAHCLPFCCFCTCRGRVTFGVRPVGRGPRPGPWSGLAGRARARLRPARTPGW